MVWAVVSSIVAHRSSSEGRYSHVTYLCVSFPPMWISLGRRSCCVPSALHRVWSHNGAIDLWLDASWQPSPLVPMCLWLFAGLSTSQGRSWALGITAGGCCWSKMAFQRFLTAALLMSVGPARRTHKAAVRLETSKRNLYMVPSFLNKLDSLHA